MLCWGKKQISRKTHEAHFCTDNFLVVLSVTSFRPRLGVYDYYRDRKLSGYGIAFSCRFGPAQREQTVSQMRLGGDGGRFDAYWARLWTMASDMITP
jgi:hypothetical protein